MPLTNEQKTIILDYCLDGYSKGILESTSIGDSYEKGEVTDQDIYDYITSIKIREKELLKNDH